MYWTRFQLLWINLLHFARLFLNQNCIFFCSSLGNFFLQIDIVQSKVPRDVPAAGSPVGQLVESVCVGGHGRVRGVAVLEEPLLQSGNLNTMSQNEGSSISTSILDLQKLLYRDYQNNLSKKVLFTNVLNSMRRQTTCLNAK